MIQDDTQPSDQERFLMSVSENFDILEDKKDFSGFNKLMNMYWGDSEHSSFVYNLYQATKFRSISMSQIIRGHLEDAAESRKISDEFLNADPDKRHVLPPLPEREPKAKKVKLSIVK